MSRNSFEVLFNLPSSSELYVWSGVDSRVFVDPLNSRYLLKLYRELSLWILQKYHRLHEQCARLWRQKLDMDTPLATAGIFSWFSFEVLDLWSRFYEHQYPTSGCKIWCTRVRRILWNNLLSNPEFLRTPDGQRQTYDVLALVRRSFEQKFWALGSFAFWIFEENIQAVPCGSDIHFVITDIGHSIRDLLSWQRR